MSERILPAFTATGLLDSAIERVIEFSLNREVMGNPISEYQHIQRRLTDMKIVQETTRCLAHDTLRRFLAHEDVFLEASVVKLFGMRRLMDAMIDAIQICATYGLQEDAQFGEVLLDALATTIGGGTEEAHRSIIFNQMARRHQQKAEKQTHLWVNGTQPQDVSMGTGVAVPEAG